MTLAAQTALPALLADKVHIAEPRIQSGRQPSAETGDADRGDVRGADSIDDVDVVRAGGMKTLFGGVYAPSTIGTLLREFSFGHARQLESVLRHHLSALCDRVDLLPGSDVRAFIDIDSLLRPVYGHAKQGASYGHTKVAGKQVLRKGLSPLAATISTDLAAPVIAGMRLRAGKTGSGKGAGRMVAHAVATARAAGVTGQILVRGDSAYGTRAVVRACRRTGAQFSLVWTKNTAVAAAIAAIPEHAWTPVRYPGAVRDPDTGAWISDAEVAEIPYTAFASTTDASPRAHRAPRQRRPPPRRTVPGVAVSPVLHRLHRIVADADITHRRHAIIETVFATSSTAARTHAISRFGANSAWSCARPSHTTCCAPPQHCRAAARPPAAPLCDARSSTFPPACPSPTTTRSAPAQPLPWQTHGFACGTTPSTTPATAAAPAYLRHKPDPNKQEKLADQQKPHAHTPTSRSPRPSQSHVSPSYSSK